MPRTFSLYGVCIEISIVFIYRLYIEIVRKQTCIMNNILLYFNVHIQALNIHPLASFAPLREFFLADIFCVIYISRQAAKVAKCIFRMYLSALRSFARFLSRRYFLRDIYFSPSRQSRKGDILKNLSVLRAFARFLSRRYFFA